jgi:hypothetical protein
VKLPPLFTYTALIGGSAFALQGAIGWAGFEPAPHGVETHGSSSELPAVMGERQAVNQRSAPLATMDCQTHGTPAYPSGNGHLPESDIPTDRAGEYL